MHGDTTMITAQDRRDRHEDVASASVLESWIDETGQRLWFLYEATRE